MTSVRNHRPLLSGNKWLLFVLAVVIGACSPKVNPVSKPAKTGTEQPQDKTEKAPEQPQAKPPAAKASVISLILPLGLNYAAAGQSYTAVKLRSANMSVEYYQGFKLALDSAASEGANFKLQVFDTKDDMAQAHSLGLNPQVKASDLIVGPVFPEDIKAFSSSLTAPGKAIVSPLSPAAPETFRNQNLVTMTPPLEYHAKGAAEYVAKQLKPKKVFILTSGFSDEKAYSSPFKRTIDSLSKRKIQVITTTISRGNLTKIVKNLSAAEQNIFLVPSTKQAFLMVTLRSLDTLSKKFPVTVIGHPNWEKFAFLKPALLQRLHTHITSSDKVDYKSGETSAFLRSYRHAYHAEPTDFAIKGFDEGLYFARMLAEGEDMRKPDLEDFTGLHNSFHFKNIPGQGWVNTHVDILRYENFYLKKVK
ncbi:amino acid ABC transporter substrate-binding protein [Mucilaginibacter sp. 21P]|uniref:ABC transporter substrate-binding protein n=1 Tax=Mucilaginibacter sp. 21P TaxID=2778902 RepID=UPI001C580828|nr:ABC transporter substrate-binding protein [Mucilaginibacter sp. 21P]QXV67204.1 amino acid ABC transporter substrate-binding protein [Mucilaginibacter sp. 21P]